MQILSFKSDLIRGNFVYGAFDLTRMVVRARRNGLQKAALARQVQTEQAFRASMDVAALNASIDGFYSNDH
jgi:hypothetical protein